MGVRDMTKVVVAPNAFKGTLSAIDAAAALGRGIRRAWPGAEVAEVPLSDGGDGFTSTLVQKLGGRLARELAEGPLGDVHPAQIGWTDSGRSAVIDLASASGLALISAPDSHTAGAASSRGLGTLLAAALAPRPRRVFVGLGGSASTDGGTGALSALGYRFLDREDRDLDPGGAALRRLAHVVPPAASRPGTEILVACDVRAPLLGADGCARTFGPQKGADAAMVAALEEGLGRLVEVVEADLGAAGLDRLPGAGAAGGCGFGLALLSARLVRGAELVCDLLDLDRQLSGAALAITGEGRVDSTSVDGKVTGEVARRAAARGVPCFVIAGSATPGAPAALADLGAGIFLLSEGGRGGGAPGALETGAFDLCRRLRPAPGRPGQ